MASLVTWCATCIWSKMLLLGYSELHVGDSLSPSIPTDLEFIPNRPRWTLSSSPSIPAQIDSIFISVHYSLSPISVPVSSNIAETCQSPKVLIRHKTQKMRHFEIE